MRFSRILGARAPLPSDARYYRRRAWRSGRLAIAASVLLTSVLAVAAGCDASTEAPTTGPPPLPVATVGQQAIVTEAFEDVEALFALGFDGAALARDPAKKQRMDTDFRSSSTIPTNDSDTADRSYTSFRTPALTTTRERALAGMQAMVDTTTYTGIYAATAGRGYLVQFQYRQPQGVGVWQARVQHARIVTGPGGAALDAVETVTLSFLSYPDLAAFMTALEAGSIPYLRGTSNDAEASFAAFDTWRVAQIYSPAEGTAVVSYANQDLRESVTVREPVVTRNANGTGNVRDGGPDGAVRTRYYGADFAVSATGTVSGTLLRTLLSSGNAADGSVLSRSDYPDASFRQTRQRGGNGVVIRENSQG